MKLYLILGVIILGFLGSVYTYYRVTQNQLALLRAEVQAQTLALETQERTITALQRDMTSQSQALTEVNEAFAQSRARVDDLQRRFNQTSAGAPRDFSNLAAERPGLVQNIVNNATRDAIRCIELDSGRNIAEYNLSADDERRLLETCGIRR